MKRYVNWFVFSIVTVAVTFIPAEKSNAQIRDWNTTNGLWSDFANWNPNLVPGLTEIARIGNLPQAHDADVQLNVNTVISGLQLYNGMRLQTDGHNMVTAFDTLITGSGTRSSSLQVQNSVFGTRDLTNDARLRLSSGTVNVSRMLENNGIVFGGGTVNLTRNSGVALRNNGTIFTNGSPFITFNQLGDGLIDLDGSTGDGVLSISSIVAQGTVTFNGTQLSDAFNGTIGLRSGNILNMNFSNGWTAASTSEINLLGDDGAVNPSRLQGGNWTLNGNLNVLTDQFRGSGAHSIEAATIIGTSADINIESDNSLAFDGPVTINGGSYILEEDAGLSFNNNTLVNGGSFNTHSQLGSDGLVSFNGITAWQGNIVINGIARQNGTAIVSGSTTFNAGILDMDGGGNASWNIGSDLVVNANGIDSTISNSFDGTMNISGPVSSRLTINLDGPGEHWTMAGEMNLTNPFNIGVTRVAGSQMRVTGDLNVSGLVGISADLTIDNPGTVSFADPDSLLFTSGTTLVEQNATFVGEGTLVNFSTGDLTLADGVTLDNVSLENYGILHIGSSTGIVDVASFENFDSGTVEIEIGGYTLGDEYDFLIVGEGPANLDGTLDILLIDAGFGLFNPLIGDEFTILTALDGVFGTFDNSPVSISDGIAYHWDVLYESHDVTLRLDSTSGVPEPGALVFIIAAIFPLVLRRPARILE